MFRVRAQHASIWCVYFSCSMLMKCSLTLSIPSKQLLGLAAAGRAWKATNILRAPCYNFAQTRHDHHLHGFKHLIIKVPWKEHIEEGTRNCEGVQEQGLEHLL